MIETQFAPILVDRSACLDVDLFPKLVSCPWLAPGRSKFYDFAVMFCDYGMKVQFVNVPFSGTGLPNILNVLSPTEVSIPSHPLTFFRPTLPQPPYG